MQVQVITPPRSDAFCPEANGYGSPFFRPCPAASLPHRASAYRQTHSHLPSAHTLSAHAPVIRRYRSVSQPHAYRLSLRWNTPVPQGKRRVTRYPRTDAHSKTESISMPPQARLQQHLHTPESRCRYRVSLPYLVFVCSA